MDGWVDGWMDGWMDGWVDGWMDGWVDMWVDRWVDGLMGGLMDGWIIERSHGFIRLRVECQLVLLPRVNEQKTRINLSNSQLTAHKFFKIFFMIFTNFVFDLKKKNNK